MWSDSIWLSAGRSLPAVPSAAWGEEGEDVAWGDVDLGERREDLIVGGAGAAEEVAAGCARPERVTFARSVPVKDLLFSPSWTGLPTMNVPRSAWPSTLAAQTAGELIDYQETIIDRQGWNHLQQDFYYRRFDAIRSGRSYR